MADVKIRPAARDDLPRLTEIYNYYVVNTPITFDLAPVTVEQRTRCTTSTVAASGISCSSRKTRASSSVGQARVRFATGRLRHERRDVDLLRERREGRGIGAMMYCVLLDALKNEDINRVLPGSRFPTRRRSSCTTSLASPMSAFLPMRAQVRALLDVVWMERPIRLAGE